MQGRAKPYAIRNLGEKERVCVRFIVENTQFTAQYCPKPFISDPIKKSWKGSSTSILCACTRVSGHDMTGHSTISISCITMDIRIVSTFTLETTNTRLQATNCTVAIVTLRYYITWQVIFISRGLAHPLCHTNSINQEFCL